MSGGRRFSGAMALLQLLATAEPAAAQSLRSRFNDLFIFGDCGIPLCLSGSDPIHAFHYIPGAIGAGNPITQRLLASLQGSIVTSLSNIPVSLGSGGATIQFVQGLPVTTPVSTGPILGERAMPLGRQRLLTGVNLTGGQFTRFRGAALRDVRLNFVHQNVGNPGLGDPAFENDVITVIPDIHVSLLAFSGYALYGVTDFLDIGVVIPVVRASLWGRSIGTIECGTPCFHAFGTQALPRLQDTARVDASATGLGDMTIRLKLALPGSGRWRVALLTEARLPTGHEDDLLGAGKLGLRAQAIASATWGVFTGHANAGYFGRGGTALSDAALATLGFDVLATRWLTVAADLAGQWQIGPEAFPLGGSAQFTAPTVREVKFSNVPSSRDNRYDGSVGFKITNNRGLTGLANAYIPLNDAGLRSPLIWTLGAQYDF